MVTGGRFWNLREATFDWLDQIHQQTPVLKLIHGCAKGADTLCGKWAELRGITVDPFPVTKSHWYRWGKNAGKLRNQDMLEQGMPDAVAVLPGEGGTHDMLTRCQKTNIQIFIWETNWKENGIHDQNERNN